MMWWLLKPDVQRTSINKSKLDAPTKWVKVDVGTTLDSPQRTPKPSRNNFLIREIKKPHKKSLRLQLLNLRDLGKNGEISDYKGKFIVLYCQLCFFKVEIS